MERSIDTSSHIIIKALTNSDYDPVDFAILEFTAAFKATLNERLLAVKQFVNDEYFHNLVYWDGPIGYYRNADDNLVTETILNPDEDWAFIQLEGDELQALSVPENPLEAHQLMITKNGYANFKAYSKYTNEEYWTEWFSIPQILNHRSIPLFDSS